MGVVCPLIDASNEKGYAEDLIVCVALGVDMFDCVYPTRTAVLLTPTSLTSAFRPCNYEKGSP